MLSFRVVSENAYKCVINIMYGADTLLPHQFLYHIETCYAIEMQKASNIVYYINSMSVFTKCTSILWTAKQNDKQI